MGKQRKSKAFEKWYGVCRWGTTGSCALRYNGREECKVDEKLKCPLDKKEETT